MNNIPSKSNRQLFMQKANNKDLNIYFKTLEQLSMKNNDYKSIYNEDREYFISDFNNETLFNLTGGGIFDFLFNRTTDPYVSLLKSTKKTPANTYCAILTNSHESCDSQFEKKIKNVLHILNIGTGESHTTISNIKNAWEHAITDFIEYLYCCTDMYSDKKFKIIRDDIVRIVNKIINNDMYLNYAVEIIRVMDYNEKKKIIPEYQDLLKRKNNAIKNFKESDLKKINTEEMDMIKKYGFGSSFLNEMINQINYKKTQRMIFTEA